MILTDKEIENLNNYWHNQLPETDRLAMENRLKMDANFRQAADEMRLITEGLAMVRLRKMKARLVGIEATLPEIDLTEETPVRRLNPRWWAVAATGLVLITAGMWFFRENTEGGLKSVAKDYFEAYPSLNSTKGHEEKDSKTAAFEAYDAQKYKKAIPLFEKAFAERGDTILLFYKGIATLGSGESPKAALDLEALEGSTIVPQQALSFYLGLAAIENKEPMKAVQQLKKAANTEGAYQQAAKNILATFESKNK